MFSLQATRQQAGFTLIELLITVAIAGILISVVIPSFSSFMQESRLSSQTNALISHLHFARSEATNQRSPVTACASTDAASCNTIGWENGWIIFTDADSDAVVDGGDEILKFREELDGGNTLRATGFNYPAQNQITFSTSGFLLTSGAATSGTFTFCDSRGATDAKGVVVTIAGASRLTVDENGDGTSDNHLGSGNNLACP